MPLSDWPYEDTHVCRWRETILRSVCQTPADRVVFPAVGMSGPARVNSFPVTPAPLSSPLAPCPTNLQRLGSLTAAGAGGHVGASDGVTTH